MQSFVLSCLFVAAESESQSGPTLWDPMDHTVRGIFQAKILHWVAFPFSRGPSRPRGWTQVSRITGRIFTSWVTKEALPLLLFGR